MSEPRTFDPGRYLTKVGTADYLEVKWRIVWFREVHGYEGSITTELVSHTDKHAVFKATVSVSAHIVATGYGTEGYDDFRDFAEKAETKAIGRALALAGFGTQFTPDHDFGAATGAVVDSPVDRQNRPGRTDAPQNGQRPTIQNRAAPASDKQLGFIRALAKERGMTVQGPDGSDHTDENAIAAVVGADFQEDWPNITKGTASTLIENWQSSRPPRQSAMMPAGPDRYTS